MKGIRYTTAVLFTAALIAGCNTSGAKDDRASDQPGRDDPTSMRARMNSTAPAQTAVAMIKPSRAATTQPVANNVMGTVTFTQQAGTMKVAINVSGLPANSTHGIHIHEKGDMSAPDLMSVGAHFNPQGHKHAGPDSPLKHAGDFGNITSDANGNVNAEITVSGIRLDQSPMGVIGRSVIIHAQPDDLKTDPSGNRGARIAGGVIEAKS